MIIDKDFLGLVESGGYYEYKGDLISEESIEIKINLYVTGDIRAGGEIIAYCDIRAGGSIIAANGNIRAGGSIWAEKGSIIAEKGDISADNGNIRAGGNIIAEKGDIWADGEIRFKDEIIFMGIKSKSIYIITGKAWPITVIDTHIKIGCELHSKEEWKNFCDSEINGMNNRALKLWNKDKDFIYHLCDFGKKG